MNEHHYHIHFHGLEGLERLFTNSFQTIIQNQIKIMKTLDEVLTATQEESTIEDSLITLVQGIKQQLTDALSGASLPPAVQEKVDAVFAQVEANKTKVSDAVTANTPAQ